MKYQTRRNYCLVRNICVYVEKEHFVLSLKEKNIDIVFRLEIWTINFSLGYLSIKLLSSHRTPNRAISRATAKFPSCDSFARHPEPRETKLRTGFSFFSFFFTAVYFKSHFYSTIPYVSSRVDSRYIFPGEVLISCGWDVSPFSRGFRDSISDATLNRPLQNFSNP